jgi:hypothetical protein
MFTHIGHGVANVHLPNNRTQYTTATRIGKVMTVENRIMCASGKSGYHLLNGDSLCNKTKAYVLCICRRHSREDSTRNSREIEVHGKIDEERIGGPRVCDRSGWGASVGEHTKADREANLA